MHSTTESAVLGNRFQEIMFNFFKKNELLTRCMTALVLIPLVVATILHGGLPFDFFVLAVYAGCVREWMRLSLKTTSLFAIAAFCLVFVSLFGKLLAFPWSLAILVPVMFMQFKQSQQLSLRKNAFLIYVVGVIYITVSLWTFLSIPHFLKMQVGSAVCGSLSILVLFLSIWGTDSGAYMCGKLLKGPKLCPRISPNKTWSGFIGGTSVAVLLNVIIYHFFETQSFAYAFNLAFPSLTTYLMAVLLISLASHFGDLLESSTKRYFGVKNSGELIPGHGGLLDRLDSLLVAAPILYVLLRLIHG